MVVVAGWKLGGVDGTSRRIPTFWGVRLHRKDVWNMSVLFVLMVQVSNRFEPADLGETTFFLVHQV